MKQIVCITAGCMFFALMLSACRTPATQLKEEQNMGCLLYTSDAADEL